MTSEGSLLFATFVRLLSVGEVWLYAWIFNPPISSNTVWFIALVASSIQSTISGLYLKNR